MGMASTSKQQDNKRVLFKEQGWTVAKSSGDAYVEHLDCPQTRFSGDTREYAEVGDTCPTYIRAHQCFFCDSEFPNYISNMLVFMNWCKGNS